MTISNSRRNLILGQISASRPIRPPWAVIEDDFIELCNRCGECVKECPRNVIQISHADGGFPVMNFTQSGCDFCEVCVAVCKPEALKITELTPFNLVAEINTDCFSERGVICRSCGEVCENQALKFKQVVGGITHVIMDTELCNGCGECVSICPAHSMMIKQRNPQEIPV